MLRTLQNMLMAPARRLMPRAAHRFARAEEAAVAVEFALVAAPFLALIFAIMETALVFFAGQNLEAAATGAGRLDVLGPLRFRPQYAVCPCAGPAGPGPGHC